MLDLTDHDRKRLWERLLSDVEDFQRRLPELRVAPQFDLSKLRAGIAQFDFESGRTPEAAVAFVVDGLTSAQLHTAHPSYFGVFNPRPAEMGVAGDFLAAAFNSQLASFPSAPFAIEIEQHLIRSFGSCFGFGDQTEGIFTSGGTEANHTALLLALAQKFPEFKKQGLRALARPPRLYVSSEAHHSFLKAAILCGLGSEAVVEIPAGRDLKFDVERLGQQIQADRDSGCAPFFVAATLGSTNAGTIDPIQRLASIASEENLWIHLDAAWGGAAVLLPELAPFFPGIAACDSITFDAHKWLSVPMTAGMFLSRHPGTLEQLFRVGETPYMPTSSRQSELSQPYAQSMGWSRRFLGLKLFLPLAVAGWDGYRQVIRHQVAMGQRLRVLLTKNGWMVLNETPLPVCCFIDATGVLTSDSASHSRLANRVAETGQAWITTTEIGSGLSTLRAGIPNFKTAEDDLQKLMRVLNSVRARWSEV